jgi:hypothetical protein
VPLFEETHHPGAGDTRATFRHRPAPLARSGRPPLRARTRGNAEAVAPLLGLDAPALLTPGSAADPAQDRGRRPVRVAAIGSRSRGSTRVDSSEVRYLLVPAEPGREHAVHREELDVRLSLDTDLLNRRTDALLEVRAKGLL